MGAKFGVRSAGVIICDNKVLMQKRKSDEFFALPGGGVEKDEFSIDAIKREFIEECGQANFSIERLLFNCECKFCIKGESFQQIGYYYLLKPNIDFTLNLKNEFDGIEEDKDILYKWISLDNLENEKIKPDFLKEYLNNLPQHTLHLLIEE